MYETKGLPVSLTIKRAIKMSEDAFKELGFQVEQVLFSCDIWAECTQIFVGCMANGFGKEIATALQEECESVIPGI